MSITQLNLGARVLLLVAHELAVSVRFCGYGMVRLRSKRLSAYRPSKALMPTLANVRFPPFV